MLRMPETGHSKDELFAELEELRTRDVPWRDGKTFAYVFHATEAAAAVAERAYQMFLWENALDPTVFPSLLEIETQIVSMAATHLSGDDEVCGNFTSGGTESVLLAVKTARDYARARNPDLGRGQVVLPVTAHPCFHKACAYFDLEAVVTPVDPTTFQADVDAMRAAITDRTVLLVGSAPSYAHGVVDPIPAIGQLALEHELLFHVDGCIGGFLLPFFNEIAREKGAEPVAFDFSVPGVTSISMDFHKYAFAAKGASVVLYRNPEIRRHQIFSYSGWPGYSIVNPTVQSSKSGGPLAACWAVLRFLGHDGYLDIVRALADATERFRRGIDAIDGLRVLGDPKMTLIATAAEGCDVFALCDEMKRRGWTMHPQMRLDTPAGRLEPSFHLTVTPINIPHTDAFLDDLAAAVAAARAAGPPSPSPLMAAVSAVDFDRLTDAQIGQLLEMAGLSGGALPGDEMADVNRVLDALPPAVTDRVLRLYYNQLSRYRERA